jgi:hypothetical protein
MKKIIAYLLMWLLFGGVLLVIDELVPVPTWYSANLLFGKCAAIGLIAGTVYCLRGVYLNKCVRNAWDSNWEVWYYIRPIVSAVSGATSCIFLKAGLLVLDAKAEPGAINWGYLAVAFIAGYNVDNFLRKLESIASSTWGIKESGASKGTEVAGKNVHS